jgi:hypothetical protein
MADERPGTPDQNPQRFWFLVSGFWFVVSSGGGKPETRNQKPESASGPLFGFFAGQFPTHRFVFID